MANRIKGLVIEIGGDATGLSKALEGVNKTIKSTQDQLKDVQKLLKMDPKSTELLTQKQKLLKESIDATKDKLATLKKASEEAAKTAGNYDAWKTKHDEVQKEIEETNAHLKDLKEQAKDAETQLAEGKISQEKYDALQAEIKETEGNLKDLKDQSKAVDEEFGKPISPEQQDALQREIIETEQELKNLEKELKNLPSSWQASMKAAGEEVKKAGEKVKSVGDGITAAGKAIMPISAAVGAVGAVGVKSFAEVDKTMQLTNKTMGNTEEQAQLLNRAMKDAASNSTFGMADAATATLNFARAGLNAEEAAAALAPAMNLAAGEGGNLDTVSGGLVATINGFHGSFDEAGHYADVFASACNNSALDVDSLSHSMSVAAPIFSTAGYSVEDAALYLGVMADNGIDADKAANSLKTGLARLVDPAKAGAQEMEKLGISVTNADGSMKSSTQIQLELHEAFENLSESEQMAAASAIFGKNQMAPWLALIRTSPDDVSDLKMELDGASVSIDSFAEELGKSGKSYDEIKEKLEKLGISGETVDDMLKSSGGDAALFVDGLHECADAGVTMGDIMDAVGGSTKDLQTAMDGAKGTTDEMAEAMMEGFGGSLEKLKSTIDVAETSIGEALAPKIKQVTDIIQGLMDKFNALDPEQQQMIATIGLVVAAIGPVLVILGTVTHTVGDIMTAIGGLMGAIAGLSTPMLVIIGVIAAVIGAGVLLYTHWDWVKEKAGQLVSFITEKWEAFKTATAEKFTAIKEAVAQKVSDMKAAAEQKVQELKDAALQKFQDTKDGLLQKAQDIRDGIEQKFQDAKDAALQKFQDIKDGIRDKIDGAKQIVEDVVTNIKNAFNFEWHLPSLRLPHIRVERYIQVPVLGTIPDPSSIYVDWYAKAMQSGMILDSPTIFGMKDGKLLAGGEAGQEAVVGTRSLMSMITNAVQNAGNTQTVNYGGVKIIVNAPPGMDIRALAREIEDRINDDVLRRKAGFA